MTRRARVSWLLNDTAPTGRAAMAARRMRLLADRHRVAAFYLNPSPAPPRHSPLGVLRPARSLGGEARLARSDIVVTTTESTAASAVARRTGATRIVHFVHDRPDYALSTRRLMQSIPALSHVVVPLSVDPAEFAARAGIAPARVTAMDDFADPAESLPGTARPRTALLAGRITPAVRDVVAAFRLALPRLPGWQLRVIGGGPDVPALAADVEAAGLESRVLVLGPRHDVARQLPDAGVVVHLDADDVNGLSVIEALAAGVPVLGGPDVPAVRRFVRDGHNGLVPGRLDTATVADALVALADDERRAALAANARASRTGLADAGTARALHELVDRVLAEPPGAPQ